MKRLPLVVFLFVVLFFGMLIARAQASNLYFTGHGLVSTLGMNFAVGASRVGVGTVRGEAVLDNEYGPVVELVSPSGIIDYWCIHYIRENTNEDVFLFVKDISFADQFSLTGGQGANCANSQPSVNFQPVDTGNFVGEVVPDTCPGDLATCTANLATVQAQVTTLTTQLSTCQSNLAQCEATLGECTDMCEALPVLPANYSAKLNGKGGDIKIAAVRKKSSPLDDFSGKISGIGTSKWVSNVLSLVAPSDGKPNWCAEGTIASAVSDPSLIGKKVVVYVRDISKKYDLMSVQIGVSLTCANTTPGVLTLIVDSNFAGGIISTL
ncbi:MAG: hypothetical protein Q8L52_00030 [bacterium]|nr:hypothetical protein [bacterium]